MTLMEKSHLRIAKEYIELLFKVEVLSIDFRDGVGNKFIVTTKDNPLKKQFVSI